MKNKQKRFNNMQYDKILFDIRNLSSNTIATLLEKEGLGEFRKSYKMIDKIQIDFYSYVDELISLNSIDSFFWYDLWVKFISEYNLNKTAYELGLFNDYETIIYNEIKNYNIRISNLQTELKDIITSRTEDIRNLSIDKLQKLAECYILNKLINAYRDNRDAIVKSIKEKMNELYTEEFIRNNIESLFNYARLGVCVLKSYSC